jgi:hypothetical protein
MRRVNFSPDTTAIRLPSGLKTACVTAGSALPGALARTAISRPFSADHKLTRAFCGEMVATSRPSGLSATSVTMSPASSIVRVARPVSTLKIDVVPERDVAASQFPSRLKARLETGLADPLCTCLSARSATDQIRVAPSPVPLATKRPSALKVAVVTVAPSPTGDASSAPSARQSRRAPSEVMARTKRPSGLSVAWRAGRPSAFVQTAIRWVTSHRAMVPSLEADRSAWPSAPNCSAMRR